MYDECVVDYSKLDINLGVLVLIFYDVKRSTLQCNDFANTLLNVKGNFVEFNGT